MKIKTFDAADCQFESLLPGKVICDDPFHEWHTDELKPAEPLPTMSLPYYTPVMYTVGEGCYWEDWYWGEIPEAFLTHLYKEAHDFEFDRVSFHRKAFHALRFEDGRVWDCINTWR